MDYYQLYYIAETLEVPILLVIFDAAQVGVFCS